MNTEDVLRAAFPSAEPDSGTSFYAEISDLYTALAFADLFWPPCFEVHDAIFVGVGANSPEWVRQGVERIRAHPGARTRSWPEFVDSFNWFEVEYLFGNLGSPYELQGEAAFLLAEVLQQQTWTARLALSYPELSFEVRIDEATKDVGLR